MNSSLRLLLLGGLQIKLDGTEVEGFVSRKAQALLAYLAVSGRSHLREALAGLLWSEATAKRAAGNLRVILSNLRQLLPDHVSINRQSVALHPEQSYWSDAAAFAQKVRSALAPNSGRPLPGAAVAELKEALSFYQGDFLAGFHLRGAQGFDEWASLERERLHGLAMQALHHLVEYHSERGGYADGIRFAKSLLALEPWREETHRQLMRLLALGGQRSAALAQYETCRRLLEQELGLEPLEETTALYEQLCEQELPRLGRERDAPAPDLTLPFVGRGDEYTQLLSWWEAAGRGQGGLALLEGEAGVGKTRLAQEVLRCAATRGAVILQGRCYEFGGSLPYQPIADALR
ncbi:MAG: AAA family ATPase, partial [Chloroflexia bacterium]|nr:AAA family ATPase [Chloroflexia bacterium]